MSLRRLQRCRSHGLLLLLPAAPQPASAHHRLPAVSSPPFTSSAVSCIEQPHRRFSAVKRSSVSSASSSSVSPSSFSLSLALRLLRCFWVSPVLVPTVSLAVRLRTDPRRPQPALRGTVSLPHGSGQRVRIAVFARGAAAAEALAAGADLVGAEDLQARVQAGDVAFDRCIATPDCMPLVSRVARVLGPRGLMPSPKLGSVTTAVGAAVTAARAGQAQFKTDRSGVLRVVCGRLSFTPQQLHDNVTAAVQQILAARQAAGSSRAAGGAQQQLDSAFLHATHSPSVQLNTRLEPFRAPQTAAIPPAIATTAAVSSGSSSASSQSADSSALLRE